MTRDDRHKANLRLAFALAGVAVVFLVVYVGRIVIFGA